MARIEIPLEEYNSMKAKIKSLEESLVESSKKESTYKEKLDILEGIIGDLEDEGAFERLFHWKRLMQPFKNMFANV